MSALSKLTHLIPDDANTIIFAHIRASDGARAERSKIDIPQGVARVRFYQSKEPKPRPLPTPKTFEEVVNSILPQGTPTLIQNFHMQNNEPPVVETASIMQGPGHAREDEVGSDSNDEESQALLATSSPREFATTTKQPTANSPHSTNAPAGRQHGNKSSTRKVLPVPQHDTNIRSNHIPTGPRFNPHDHQRGNELHSGPASNHGRAREPVPIPHKKVSTEPKKRNHHQISSSTFANTSSSAAQPSVETTTPSCFRCKQRGPLPVLKRSCCLLIYCTSCGPHSSAKYKYPLCIHRREEMDENTRKAETMRQVAHNPSSELHWGIEREPDSNSCNLGRDSQSRRSGPKRRRHK